MDPKQSSLASTDTVTVGCKLPWGLKLRLFKMEPHDEPVMGGGMKSVSRAVQFRDPVVINGCAVAKGVAPEHPIVGGYGLTYNVNAEFFAEWLKQNADHPAVRNNMIFAQGKSASARDQAKEMRGLRSGQEPIAQRDDPRVPRGKVKIEPGTTSEAA